MHRAVPEDKLEALNAEPAERVVGLQVSAPSAEASDGAWWDHEKPSVDGKFLRVEGKRFWARGVTYGTFAPNERGEPFPPYDQLCEDFARMAEAGINTVRLYTPPSDRIADAAAEFGLYLVPDICWGPRTCEWDHAAWRRIARDYAREHARRLADHPAILMLSLGNEIPPLVVRWYGREKTEQYLRELAEEVRNEAPEALLTYANHPPSEHLNLSFLDVVSFNIYLDREKDFRDYLARLQMLCGPRPLFLSEIGFDRFEHGEAGQARHLDWQLRAGIEKGICGSAVYSWTDEWSVHQEAIEGWAFGLTDARRQARPALAAVGQVYQSDPYNLRETPWPRVSVVVATYNGAATLDQCLRSVSRLNYPDYEVIVIDDGSRDATPEIVERHPVRCIRVENGGLSRARNLGIEAAAGEVVAFLDSDAYADEDWLYYLVTSMEEQGASGVGGPNLSPTDDGFIAQCVDHAPGNPTHVLLDDQRAEHVPGCNMAFRKDALDRIGRFDPTHRAAGDDVDVCWKLLVREETIAFSPAAVVWHHRRPTVWAYLKQQKGYGYAEAFLQRGYPGRFNLFGHQVWRGSIYDGVHHHLRQDGLPALFRPRVYQGYFCGAPFQSLYQPFLTWWFQVFLMVEWQALWACVLAAALLGLALSPPLGAALMGVWAAMLVATLSSAAVPAWHAGRAKRWPGRDVWRGRLVVAALHIAQPLARAAGRLKGIRHSRDDAPDFPASRRLYGNLLQRSVWLERLPAHLRMCGWVSRPCDEWDTADLEVTGPGPYTVRLTTVYEDDVEHGVHYIRYRLTSRMKRSTPLLIAAVLAGLFGVASMPALVPLLLPLGLALQCLLASRHSMLRAISQLALECAEPLGMTRAEEDF